MPVAALLLAAATDPQLPLLAQAAASTSPSALPAKVGDAGDPGNLVFEGVQTFTDTQIRHELALMPSYLLASHPHAVAALYTLLNPEFFSPVTSYLGGDETNTFTLPPDDMDRSLAQSPLTGFLVGHVPELSNQLFPKHSWPWTLAREAAFVMMNQGRYTDAELERLCDSEEIGPIGFLAIARLLALGDSPMAKDMALRGLTRLSAQDFLRDCSLFLQGDAGLARGFAGLAETLRTLPEAELTALAALLPEEEAALLRDSATALRTQPEGRLDTVLSPVFTNYWNQSLRANVRAELHRLSKSKNPEQRADCDRSGGVLCAARP
jgi:hypothetical protein